MMGDIFVTGRGSNIWTAIADALLSYAEWHTFFLEGYTQGSANKLWGETDDNGTNDNRAEAGPNNEGKQR